MPKIKRFVPTPDQLVYTFGGNPPIMTIEPGEILDLFTEDALGGKVRSTADIPSQKAQYPYINPQTGPFFSSMAQSRVIRWPFTC